MLEKVKLSLRITSSRYDSELNDLIAAALLDMGLAGVETLETSDSLIIRAVTTYCKMNFGAPADYDRLKASYDEQKAQLGMATGYTSWSDDDDDEDGE